MSERVILVRTVQCKLSVKHSMCIKVFILVLPELVFHPLCLCHFNHMWRKNSLGHWMRTFSNTPSTVSNLPLLLLLLLFSCSVLSNSVIPWTEELQASLFFNIFWSLLKVMSTESVMPSNHLPIVVPFSSCLQSFPASESFLISQLFVSGGQPSFIHAYPAFLSWCLRITKVNDSTLGLWVERHPKSIHHPNQSNGSRAGIIFIFQMKKLRFRGWDTKASN